MNRFITLLILFLVGCPHATPPSSAAPAIEAGPSDCNLEANTTVICPAVEVHFSPNGGCQDAIVSHIKGSKKSIRVQAYVLTNQPILEALIGAKNSGVDVQVLLDASEAKLKFNPLPALKTAVVPAFLDSKHVIAHNKSMVFDESSIETGSYNYTNASEHDNAENCVFVEAISVAAPFTANWNEHKAHSTPAP